MSADADKSVTVFLPAHMRDCAKKTPVVETAPGSLMDVIMEVANQFPDLKEDLLRGIQEREIAIAIDEMITENDPTTRVDPGAEIRLLPAIAGGNK